MAVYKRDIVDINLETGNIHRSFLKHSIGYKDAAADHFGIRVFRNGEPVNLTGVSIQGIFMPPQGSPIAITSGNIVNYNEAEVVLPQACYNYDGQFTLAIKLVDPSNAVTGTMRIVDGMVDNTHASGTVAPTAAVPGYEEVLATYEQAIAAINKTVRFDATQSLTDTQKATARSNISAPSVAEMNTAVGNEATARQNADALKVNISDIENDLTGTTAGKVLDARQGKVLDDKITAEAATRAAADSDLKSAIINVGIKTNNMTYTIGALSGSAWPYSPSTNQKRIRSDIYYFESGTVLTISSGDNIAFYGEKEKFSTFTDKILISENQQGIVLIRKTSDADISASDIPTLAGYVTVSRPYVHTTFNPSSLAFQRLSLSGSAWPYTRNTNVKRIVSVPCFFEAGTLISVSDGYDLMFFGELKKNSDWVDFVYVENGQMAMLQIRKETNADFTVAECTSILSEITVKHYFPDEYTSALAVHETALPFEVGSLSGSAWPYTETSSSQRLRSKPMFFDRGTHISITSSYSMCLYGTDQKIVTWVNEIQVEEDQVARLLIRKGSDTTVTVNDIPAAVSALTISRNISAPVLSDNVLFEKGSLSGTAWPYEENDTSVKRIRTKVYYIPAGTKITVTSGYDIVLCGRIDYIAWAGSITVSRSQIARLLMMKSNDDDLGPEDIATANSKLTISYDNFDTVPSSQVEIYSHTNYSPINHNPLTAIKLRVGTMNIGKLNYGSGSYCGIPTDEYDDKLHNWRQYICSKNIDIMNLNEYVPYIDYLPIADALTGTKKTVDYIFKPHYRYYDSTMETAREQAEVVSKFALSVISKQNVPGDSGGWAGYCKYYRVTIDENHIIGVFAVQLPWMYNTGYSQTSPESISNRATILNGLSNIISSSTDTYKIVMGDFNIPTDTDRTNLIALCTNNNLIPANGGYLDWIRTTALNYAIDNILVSNNILINNFESHIDWYEALSTDHYGVSADITLC